jgi:DNA polymerase I
MTEPHVVDFETSKIESRPAYPPRPAGVAIREPGGRKKYYAFNHASGNTHSVAEARSALAEAYSNEKGVVFHNGPFDMDVGEVHLGLAPPKKFHETLFLAFLNDPYESDLGLKPLAEKHLGDPADERDRLRDWILENLKTDQGRKIAKTKWGEYIAQAPGKLVAPYARGDVDKTYRLFEHMKPVIKERGMWPAYKRELECVPVIMEMERGGVRVDRKRLCKAKAVFMKMDMDVVARIAKKLRVNPADLQTDDNKKGFNINSGAQLADALIRAGKMDSVVKTATGKVSTKIVNLEACCNDKELIKLLAVHSVCEKYIGTFMEPWIEQSRTSGGRILPHFNQTRGRSADGGGGARSGRLSSSNPNMQQVSANVDESKNKEVLQLMQKWLRDDYQYDFIGLRDYIIPDEGCVLIAIDYNQQELRLLAHFENGVLRDAYLKNPRLDVHEFCRQLVYKTNGVLYERKQIKTVVFGIIYGMGLGKLADGMEVDTATAKAIRAGILDAVPGISNIQRGLDRLARKDLPLITLGGRQYFCEEPRYDRVHKRWMSFEYKMLNYKIQPSAADYTKQGMVNVWRNVPQVRIALQVHDELVVMAKHRKYGPRVAAAMCDVELGVPMLADPKYSDYSWARVAE